MFGLAILFLVVALISALLGFGGIAAVAVDFAQIVFVIALFLFLVTAVIALLRGRSPPAP